LYYYNYYKYIAWFGPFNRNLEKISFFHTRARQGFLLPSVILSCRMGVYLKKGLIRPFRDGR